MNRRDLLILLACAGPAGSPPAPARAHRRASCRCNKPRRSSCCSI